MTDKSSRRLRNFAPLFVACTIMACLVGTVYAAGYFALGSISECGPAQTRERLYTAEWLANAFKPAAQVEDACSSWSVTTDVE
jgi:hypothetical protein